MSCSENDSGPYFVFFVPAAVCCLTLLLARRWATAQVANTSSTAVSRRRKIIKDPLIKRPLPPIACKMVAPGSKKSSGFSRKFQGAIPDEEMNGGKRVGKTKMSSQSINSEMKVNDGLVAPKHIPFPYIPQDGELLFEVMTFMFTLVATGLQYLNLYRTMWWIPHSHTYQAMHFHLIDWHLVGFIVAVLSRRVLFSMVHAVERAFFSQKSMTHILPATRMFVLGVVLGAMVWCASIIMRKYSPILAIFLFYPALIYFAFFGATCEPFLELNNVSPMHCCLQDPAQVRAEVELLRQDFNMRLKKIIFNSVVGAYYSCFIPCMFAPPFLYYSAYSASEHTAFVCVGLALRLSAALLAAPHCDVLHRAACHLGQWTVAHVHPEPANEISAWSASRLYAGGSLVCVSVRSARSPPPSPPPASPGSPASPADPGDTRAVLVAATPCVAAIPFDNNHRRFYAVFSNPSTLLCFILCLQLALIAVQLCVMFSNAIWHHFLGIVILLFVNYYTVFKLLRDYLVSCKVYKVENMIQDKNGTAHSIAN